jgi:chromatin segregation and condensation protein Rec8/ScpA/Scc1 (kleisin family)
VSKDKPFYLREPWSVLFKDNRLEKISPWSIDLVYLLTTLLEEMNKVGIDFRMAGTAINSSVIIYKKKAELLLKMEEPPEEPPVKPDVYVPPPLTLPFRFEFTTTTISDLITALERALTEERRPPKARLPVLPVPIPDFLEAEAYLLEIEERADNLLERLESSYRGKPLSFFDLASYDNLLEVVRVFMMLLFLAQRDKIDLYQDEDEVDILIKVKETELIE